MFANRTLQAASGASGYRIQHSLRFRASANASLTRIFGTPTDQKKWTISAWVKIGVTDLRFQSNSGNNAAWIGFGPNGFSMARGVIGTSITWNCTTSPIYRDYSGWYSITVVFDSTQATASNRIKLYTNGVEITTGGSYPALNEVIEINASGFTHTWMNGNVGSACDGYLSEVNFIDGQALTPASFGQIDPSTGAWIPKRYAGTYGTNGFYLDFSDTTSVTTLGYDKHTNSRTFSTASTFNYTIPSYSSSLVIKLWGGGGGGGGGGSTFGNSGTNGTATTFSTLSAGGGGGGTGAWTANPTGVSGAGGTASGGDINTNGNSVATVNGTTTGAGAPNGGGNVVATANAEHYNGTAPGGGATGGRWAGSGNPTGGGGGSGAYVEKTYSVGGLTPGTTLSVTVGAGGTGGSSDADQGANGAAGRIMVIVDGVVVNDWTPNNISLTAGSTYDSMLDVPTPYPDGGNGRGNYATLNPIWRGGSNNTYSAGNLTFSYTAPATPNGATVYTVGTQGATNGKWYYEFTVGATVNDAPGITSMVLIGATPDFKDYVNYFNTGTFQNSGGSIPSAGASFTTNDVIGVAYDLDAYTVAFYKNNVLQGTVTGFTSGLTWFPSTRINTAGSGGGGTYNFGQRPFSYTPPTGFKALHTGNLPVPTIRKGDQHFDIIKYTAASVNGTYTYGSLAFQPDFIWIKNRDNVERHFLIDVIRGNSNITDKFLVSSDTSPEGTNGVSGTTFSVTPTGYQFTESSIGVGELFFNSRTYVGWNWKAGGAAVSNTAGSITSQVSANPTAGFSIVTWTGTAVAATIGHGLNAVPNLIIYKTRSLAGDWVVGHTNLISWSYSLFLNQTAAQAALTTFNNTTPTSSVFSIGSGYNGPNGITMVAYCFAEISGFSKFGSYTGNGSADGPFVYCGFRPKYVMIKRTDSTGNWRIVDTVRDTYNVDQFALWANDTSVEGSGASHYIDTLSNGFKIRNTSLETNASGGTLIFMAFAEVPFKYANAR